MEGRQVDSLCGGRHKSTTLLHMDGGWRFSAFGHHTTDIRKMKSDKLLMCAGLEVPARRSLPTGTETII